MPTDAYGLDDAVRDGFLVPPKAVSVPLKFQREGIKYDDLSEEEKDQWDAIEWDEDGNIPDAGRGRKPSTSGCSTTTPSTRCWRHLMTHGLKVAGGDRLGKTIIFAKNHDHAVFIARAVRCELSAPQGTFRARHRFQDRICAEPDR